MPVGHSCGYCRAAVVAWGSSLASREKEVSIEIEMKTVGVSVNRGNVLESLA